MKKLVLTGLVVLAGTAGLAGLQACGQSNSGGVAPAPAKLAAQVDAKSMQQADADTGQWLSYGRTYSEQRFVPLDKINAENVATLGLAWHYKLDIDRGIEATPLIIDGVMYTTGAFSMVYALDARTGALLWKYDPKVAKAVAGKACCGVINRGVAAWQGKIFVGAFDGRLIALDAQTGKPLWSTQTVDESQNYTITGAPRVINGKVIIGNGGAELGVRGYVSAYAADTGEMLWRFYTVPGDPAKGPESLAMEMARKTWFGDDYYKQGGGGTVWDAMAYDPELNLLYIGVGNGSPWNIKYRSEGKGDNLFLSSIVALNADTGKYVWHYQTTPGDSWDYTATQHIILADLKIDGHDRKVLMQAPKNGFFYVLDRKSGDLISANNFAPVNWASGIDPETDRPIITGAADYSKEPKLVMPSPLGAHNWQPMSFNPSTGLVYIPAQIAAHLYEDFGQRPVSALNLWNVGTAPVRLPDDPQILAGVGEQMSGQLLAWDPVQQKAAWSVDYPTLWNGGTLSTAGNLVFQGTADGRFTAYSADKGELLWQTPANTGVMAGPVSFELDGEQYVTVMAGWGGVFGLAFAGAVEPGLKVRAEARVLTFKLGGKASLPAPKLQPRAIPAPVKVTASADELAIGKDLYNGVCATCHGLAAIGNNLVPDLRYMDAKTQDEFVAIVSGSRAVRGMPAFGHVLPPAQIELIKQYVASRAQALVESIQPAQP